jgi:hypothetical protein
MMCDADGDAPADAAPAESAVDSLSEMGSAVFDKIKGLTLLEAGQLNKEMRKAFNLDKDEEEDDSADDDAPAEE